MKFLAVGLGACVVMAYGAYASSGIESSRTIEISINHSAFETSKIVIEKGEEVTFILHNNDPIDHEFIVGDAKVQAVHERGTEGHHDDRPTEVTLPAGETVETTISFDDGGPLVAADPLLFGCHLPGHYDYGMKGFIRVT
ncbi:MAG: cupredoxin domain-containing protein [Actinomycetota bacterium]|nr:cupredoxin domain-containing protein [Actinomycetota bacterium]